MRLLLDESVRGKSPVAVIVLDALSNELTALLPLVPALEQVLLSLNPRTYTRIASEA